MVPFKIAADGKLVPVTSGGLGVPSTPPLLLGLVQHPTANIIYAGIVGANQVGVFTFDNSGNLTLVDTLAAQGKGQCWTTVSADGKYLYTADTGTNSVGVYSLADPLHPVQIQEFVLGGPQNSSGNASDPRQTTDFEFALDPNGKALYVIDHQTTSDGSFPQGNALHVLSIAADGTLTEGAGSPLLLPTSIPAGADPQGVAVVAAQHDNDGAHG